MNAYIRPGKKSVFHYISYSSITNFEISENGISVYKGGLGRAVAGGILFGGIGAVGGGVTANKNEHRYFTMQLKLYLNTLDAPVLTFDFLLQAAEPGFYAYDIAKNQATKAMGILRVLQATPPPDETPEPTQYTEVDAASLGYIQELKDLNDLRQSGVITEEEFQQQKAKILGNKLEKSN